LGLLELDNWSRTNVNMASGKVDGSTCGVLNIDVEAQNAWEGTLGPAYAPKGFRWGRRSSRLPTAFSYEP
jgi:hypothetical protein